MDKYLYRFVLCATRAPGFVLVVLSLVAAGCLPESTTGPNEGERIARSTPTTRIILKLRDPALDPARPELLHDLSREAGLSLVYLRPMSGQAHVLTVTGAPEAGVVVEGLRRLRAMPIVEYAEADQTMRHQEIDAGR